MRDFDHKVIDNEHSIRLDVTRSRDADDFLLLSIQSADHIWPCTRVCISTSAAAELAHALLAAIHGLESENLTLNPG